MDDTTGQGSPASPSVEDAGSSVDLISAHLSGGQTQTEATTQPETSQSVETEPQTEGQAEETQGRAEQRIQELIKQNTELQQKAAVADQLQMFIASNPQARAAYEQAINQGYSQEQAQQIATGQPQGQEPKLPDWDPYDEEVVTAHREAIKKEAKAELMQELNPLLQFVQQQQQQQIQDENKQLVSSLDNLLFQEIPEAKESGTLEFAVANQFYLEEMRSIEPEYQQALQVYAYLNPQQKQMVQDRFQKCVKDAASKAKQVLTQRGLTGVSTQQPAQGVQRQFVEGATNLVSPRPTEPQSINDSIMAHINHSSK